MKLPIADCRLLIGESLGRGGFVGRGHDGCEFVGLLQQGGQLARGHEARFDQQFEPQSGFVGFFLDGSDLGNEFGLAAGPATGAVVSRAGCPPPATLVWRCQRPYPGLTRSTWRGSGWHPAADFRRA